MPSGRVFKFNKQSVQDQDKSLEAGHPVFVEQDYIEIRIPGDATSRVHRALRQSDLMDPEIGPVYEHWKKTQQMPVEGLPLEQWPGVSAAQVDTLRVVGVRTVEALAAVSDQHVSTLGMGYQTLRQKAMDYLAAAKDNAHLEKMRAEMDGMRSQLEAAQRQLKEAMDELRTLKAPPGRPDDGGSRRQRT